MTNQTDLFEEPRGIRNKNPCNIRTSHKFVWREQTGADSDGFCIFSSPCWGMRAACRIWHTYQEVDGCKTLAQYITRWAPPPENNTDAYIHYVASRLYMAPDDVIDIHAKAFELLVAVIMYENGEQPYSPSTIRKGITLSHER